MSKRSIEYVQENLDWYMSRIDDLTDDEVRLVWEAVRLQEASAENTMMSAIIDDSADQQALFDAIIHANKLV